MMKKVLAASLAAVMTASMLAACGTSANSDTTAAGADTEAVTEAESEEETEAQGDVPVIKFTTFTCFETMTGDAGVEQAINDYLDENGYKFHVDLDVISMTDYTTSVDMNLASATDLDVFLDLSFSTHVSQGSDLALDDYFENELAGAVSLFDQEWLDACAVNGVHYAIPAYTTSSTTNYYIVRKDIIDEIGYDTTTVTDLDSLEDLFAAIHEAHPEMWCTDTLSLNPFTLLAAQNTYGYFSTTYGVGMSADNIGTMENMYASDMFKEACEMATRWYNAGYLNPSGSTDSTYSPDYIAGGQSAGWLVGNCNDADTQAAQYGGLSGYDLVAIPLSDIPDSNAGFTWAIAQSSKYPSEAAQLLNLTYTDEFILNAICYGTEEDGDYVWNEDHTYIEYPEGKDRTTVPYSYYVGITVVGDRTKAYSFGGYYSDSDRAYIEDKIANNKRTGLYGMNLDITDVSTQVASVTNVVNQYYDGLMCGELDADTYLPQFLDALEAAGINDIISAAQSQYDARQ